MINPKYISAAEVGNSILLKQTEKRDPKFYSKYRKDGLVDLHKDIYPLVKPAQEMALWPEFSLRKIKLFPGETLTDLLLANAIVLAHEYTQQEKSTQQLFAKAIEYYNELASKRISLASPFFNNLRKDGKANLSSCFIMEVGDSLKSIMKHVTYCAEISKAGGGAGVYVGKIRAKGAPVNGHKNAASSVMNWVRMFDQVCVSVNQLGQRPGAITVALPIWHADIEEFLDCQTENGDLRAKAYNIQPQVCIPDYFMKELEAGSDTFLFCPYQLEKNNINPSKDKGWYEKAVDKKLYRESVSARKLWAIIQEREMTVGRPYIFYTDNAQINSPFKKNYGNINSANLCCGTGDTLLLTKDGYERLDSLEGQEKEVWNGEVFSLSKIFKTSESSDIFRVTFSDCSYVDVTDYHRWFTLPKATTRAKEVIKLTKELVPGTIIPKIAFPVIEGAQELLEPYSNGFYSGDGNDSTGGPVVTLVGEKSNLAPLLKVRPIGEAVSYTPNGYPMRKFKFMCDLQRKFFVPDVKYSVNSRIEWLAGLLDADGCVAISSTGKKALQLTSINKEFIDELRLMLNTLGIDSSCGFVSPNREWKFKGGSGVFKPAWRISINSTALNSLIDLGLICYRLDISKTETSRDATTFKKVVSVVKLESQQPTWCLIEPLKHKVVFNGTVTSQCFSGETLILTKQGERPIASIAGTLADPTIVRVWNGLNYANAPVYKVADEQVLYRVTFSQGQYVDVTEDHNFFVATQASARSEDTDRYDKILKVQTRDLKKGMQLPLVHMPGTGSTSQYLQKAKNYVTKVTKLDGLHTVYCLTEPLRNMVIANGVPTGQCESYSYFEAERYIHCCNLASINLAEHTSLESISKSTEIATEMADLSLNLSFIDIEEAQNHVRDFRTIGVGMMGLADWLAANGEYYSSLDFIEKTQKAISIAAYKTSVKLASKWGACLAYDNLESELWDKLDQEPGLEATRELRAIHGIRNAMLLATAPNTSTSLVMGATASFLPPYSHEFYDESEDHTLPVVCKYDPDSYLTNRQIPQEFITDATAVMQKYMDAGISMEYLYPKGASWSTNKAVSKNKIEAWKKGVKAVYYIRTIDTKAPEVSGGNGTSSLRPPEIGGHCSACAN